MLFEITPEFSESYLSDLICLIAQKIGVSFAFLFACITGLVNDYTV